VNDKGITSVMVRKSVAVQHCLLRRKYFSQLNGLPLEIESYMNTDFKKDAEHRLKSM
jgi:hypothetical protein